MRDPRTSGPSLEAAARAWAQVVGEENILLAPADLEAREAATYRTNARVAAVVRPASREEVQACVRIASDHLVPIYPVSSGKNWGYGSRVPCESGCAILELGRMNRIMELDEDLAYVVVEPGVTQRQLYTFLQERTAGRLWIDATSSSFDCSLIGNLLERGHGGTMYCDHVACAAGYEVVLPDGTCIETGYGAFGGGRASARAVDPWGVGPSLMGLFSQSSLGIVTRAAIWLMRAPQESAVAFFTFGGDDELAAFVDAVRPLRLDRILKSGPFLGNVYQAVQKVMTYPWDATGGRTPLPHDVAVRLAAEHRYGAWNGSIGLCGTRAEVAEQKEALRAALAGRASWSAFVDRQLGDLGAIFPASRHREVRAVVAGFTGGVGGTGLPAAYWRMGGPPTSVADMDLDRDRCGFKFWTATTPWRGRDARQLAVEASEIVLRHGFEPSIGIFPVRERALQFHIACAYDRAAPGHDDAVLACHDELAARLLELGHFPTRLGVGSMQVMESLDERYASLLGSLKEVFDPRGILAPGRYGAPRWSAGRPAGNRR